MRIIFIVAILFVLGGCASTKTIMTSWVGSSIDDVAAKWGAPNAKMDRADGGNLYTWKTLTSNMYGVSECNQSFITDPKGIIVSWSYSGNCGF